MTKEQITSIFDKIFSVNAKCYVIEEKFKSFCEEVAPESYPPIMTAFSVSDILDTLSILHKNFCDDISRWIWEVDEVRGGLIEKVDGEKLIMKTNDDFLAYLIKEYAKG